MYLSLQRLAGYIQLSARLSKLTPEEHADKRALEQAATQSACFYHLPYMVIY